MSMRDNLEAILRGPGALCDMSEDDARDTLDALLDNMMLSLTPSVFAEALKPYASDRPLHPSHGIESAGQLPAWHVLQTAWRDMLVAIKEGK